MRNAVALAVPAFIALVLAPSGCSARRSCAEHAAAAPMAASSRPTDVFRAHHAQITEHLGHIDAMAMELPGQANPEQRRTMHTMVSFMKEHIASHAADEERVLYPVVQRQAGPESRMTAVPVHEHRIVERLIADLDRESALPHPDVDRFVLVALHLTGLLHAHFEIEEEVLLPVLDATMSREQFQREVADKMPH